MLQTGAWHAHIHTQTHCLQILNMGGGQDWGAWIFHTSPFVEPEYDGGTGLVSCSPEAHPHEGGRDPERQQVPPSSAGPRKTRQVGVKFRVWRSTGWVLGGRDVTQNLQYAMESGVTMLIWMQIWIAIILNSRIIFWIDHSVETIQDYFQLPFTEPGCQMIHTMTPHAWLCWNLHASDKHIIITVK